VGPDHDSPKPRASTLGQQQYLTPPHGHVWCRHVSRESDTEAPPVSRSGPHGKVLDPCIYSPGLRGWPRTSTCANRTPRMGSGPLCVGSRPLTAGSRDSRIEYTQGLDKAQAGVRCRHVSGPYRIHFCSPSRRRPDAATWPTTRDVSQRTEPGVSLWATPPLHLLRIRRALVHSSGRRRAWSMLRGPCYYSSLLARYQENGRRLSILRGLRLSWCPVIT
jgi:hypothetical protein